MSILIRDGRIVAPEKIIKGDLAIVDGKIEKVAPFLNPANYDEIVNAKGKYILPGFIDPHVHCRLPMRGIFSADDFGTGTKAAAAGGVTTIIDFATQIGDQSLKEAISDRRSEADGEVYVDYSLHGGITNWSRVKPELKEITSGGINSFKMFMAYKERGLFSSNEDILDALKYCRDLNSMILVHAESEELLSPLLKKYSAENMIRKYGIRAHLLSRPDIVEEEAIRQAISLVSRARSNLYVVHISTGKGSELINEARKQDINVVGETCPQYLMFNESVFEEENGHYYATAPQIKSEGDRLRLWEQLTNGIQVIGTDSCSFTTEQKDTWDGDFTKLPLGLPGTELMASVLFSEGVRKGRITLRQFVNLISTNASKIFGLYPKKGAIIEGSDADITVFDPNYSFEVDPKKMETNTDWSPYQGMTITGAPLRTYLRGKLIGENLRCVGEKGYGRFLVRDRSGDYLN